MAKSTKDKFDREALLSAVKKRTIAPLYFFYGEEDYLIEELVDEIIDGAVDETMKEFNLDILHGNETDGKKVAAMASAYPMMAERRVVLVKDFDRLQNKEALEPYFENPSPTTVLIILSTSSDGRKKVFQLLKKNASGGECPRFYDNQIPAWIVVRLKKMKRTATPGAIALLHSYVGNSLRELSNEIEKVLIAIGEKSVLEESDIERVVGISKEFTIFELNNDVSEKNISRAIEIAERLLNSGESAIPIIASLAQHFIKLLKLGDARRQFKSDYEIANAIGVHSFFLSQYTTAIKKYSTTEIENALLALANADEAIKTSRDPKLVLTTALAEILAVPSRMVPSSSVYADVVVH